MVGTPGRADTDAGSENADAGSDERLEWLLAGLARQESLLAVTDSIDALLSDAAFATRKGEHLHAAFTTGHRSTVDERPLVAAAFLEGLLRLAILGGWRPFEVLAILTARRRPGADPDYLERLPTLLGAALDVWGAEPTFADAIRAALAGLPDAGYELALDELRQAVDAPPEEVPARLENARTGFVAVTAAEEGRLDADLHVAGIDALVAFLARDLPALRRACRAVVTLVDERTRLSWPAPPPLWREPRHAAELRWERLAIVLDRAAATMAEEVWLDAIIALGEIREAYEWDAVPLPGAGDAAGLRAAIRATVEEALRSNGVLRLQTRRAAEEDGSGWLIALCERLA
ncbi:hypothetical protein Val02_38850 [Virgisporangium aliadipatigenens]|uniref:Uncharacterized protein n=1 Tax=Virgisporangium aliadipatigenens TaxID=741659 RepID=A0A8J3YKF7_9ACTN|nr:hypothetical protein [Virgisporangium aliadipatigenens]GIJ46999.1 hypothetical protein Val02_38850 [Virgisporangium aliadipatigenens]